MCEQHVPLPVGSDCDFCGNYLSDEERTHPITPSGARGPVCESCYREEYRDICVRCQEWTDNDDLSTNPGQLVGVWSNAPGIPHSLQPGYYRVKGWPFHVDYMLGGHFYSDKLERVADLDTQGQDGAKEAFSCGSPLCGDCRQQVEALLQAQ